MIIVGSWDNRTAPVELSRGCRLVNRTDTDVQTFCNNLTATTPWPWDGSTFLQIFSDSGGRSFLDLFPFPPFCYRCHHSRQHKQKCEGVHFWPMNVLDYTAIAQPTFHLNVSSIYILSRGCNVWTIPSSLWTTILEVVNNINTCAIALRTMPEKSYGTSNQGIKLTYMHRMNTWLF